MKTVFQITLITLLLASMTACAEKSLVPGDKLGEMELLSFCEGVNILDICSFDMLQAGTCEVPASTPFLWISAGWGEKTSEELETAWQDSTWTLTFDDHQVDLPAFGTYDMDITDPVLGPMKARTWNFCISNPQPGKHQARYDYTFVHGSRPGKNAQDWSFTVLEPSQPAP